MSEIQLDTMDVTILGMLQQDGRMSFTDIAAELEVSVGMVRNRYNRLIENRIIHIIGWTDPVKAGLNAYARVLLAIRPSKLIRQVAAQLAPMEEVSFLAQTSGNHNLEINLICSNNEQLLQVIHDRIHSIEGVYETSTTMYLEVMKWASHDVRDVQKENKN